MKIIVYKHQLSENPDQFLRHHGYAFIRDNARGKESYVRRLSDQYYPRLHMYFSYQGEKVVFDLHLDQKQASYKGQRMHNAEHSGEIVENEIARLGGLIKRGESDNLKTTEEFVSIEEQIGHKEPELSQGKKNKKWWKLW